MTTKPERTYRVYATLPQYVYTDIKTTSPHKARFLACTQKQQWHNSADLDAFSEPVEPLPTVQGIEEIE